MRGDGRVFRRGNRFWIAYYHGGEEFREPGGRTEAEARRRLRERRKEIAADRFVGLGAERITVDDLFEALLSHLATRGVKSLSTVVSHVKTIRARFGHVRALELSPATVERYMAERLEAGKAPATVNREVQPLSQAFRLAHRQGRIPRVPYIPRLRENNARQGFFEHDEFEAVVAELPEAVADIARLAYLSGWRRGEILGLRWQAVDRKAREVRLATSKSGYGRVLPLDGLLWDVIERRWAARRFRAADGSAGLSAFVFHNRGRPLQDFKHSWASACERAGVPEKLFHDLRRTAVRNMIRAGVPQSVAMAISGHRTVSMFLRYNITSDEDLRRAIRQTQAHLGSA